MCLKDFPNVKNEKTKKKLDGACMSSQWLKDLARQKTAQAHEGGFFLETNGKNSPSILTGFTNIYT